ncbi:hypothetical protein BTN50_1696 (plasmid) [Candidatus Enterovibrio altilux]|uniref:Uncharacterized protein n=1 Tax=Candidatus Enterovibrio altilux TaxID=1927128 RepID=A0A291BAW0_9GAMM|nr:hypothetical protein BTN50_1696 [Candidatus Enterovibrio luxaltus]
MPRKEVIFEKRGIATINIPYQRRPYFKLKNFLKNIDPEGAQCSE